MSNQAVSQFTKSMHSFNKVFNHLSLICVAIKNEKKWISIYTCLMLANTDDARVFEPQIVKAKSELVALFATYPVDSFEVLLKEIENGCLSVNIGSKIYKVYLTRVAAGLKSQSVSTPQLHFSSVWRPSREYAPDPEAYRSSMVLQTLGDRFYELLSQDDNERISKVLRGLKRPYNGLDGLLQFVGTRHRPNSSSDQALIEIKAVFPFKVTTLEDQVFVDCPKSLAPKLSMVFFFSGHESIAVRYSKSSSISGRPNCVSVPFHIEWPSNVSQAQAHVLYGTIVRLLTLAGMAVTWHGDIRQSGRPDLAGYCEIPGRRIALIGECTLEKPNLKLDALKSRRTAVLQLAGKSAEVLPVVFTACDPIHSDYENAAAERIALIGRNQIGLLLQLVERNSRLSEVIKQIENGTIVNGFSGIARWADRYS